MIQLTPKHNRRLPKHQHTSKKKQLQLQIYNTLTKRKEIFIPLESAKVRMYTCGLTVNYLMHIGHARVYIFWDIVERFLQYMGFEVQHVSNITDISVDDNILKRVQTSGEAFQQLVTRYTKDYYHDRHLLGIAEPYTYAIATQHIQDMIELVQRLLNRGFAYEADDGVYFRINKFSNYGQLANLDSRTLLAGGSGRIDKDEYDKENVGDFVLWKRAKPDEPFWHSPWGPGRPGWHIECSAMSMKYLGDTIDISGGGEDNLFPHHENAIAQSEAASGKPYVRYWMHVRHLQLEKLKMSKSTGHFLTVRDVLKDYEPATLRLFLLTTHYRKPITFNNDDMLRSHQRLNRLRYTLNRLQALTMTPSDTINDEDEGELISKLQNAKTNFEEALLDDFNTGRAINFYFQFVNQLLKYLETQKSFSSSIVKKVLHFFEESGTVLFGDLYFREIFPKSNSIVTKLVELLINERTRLRNTKQYQQADAIRTSLQTLGFEIADINNTTKWWRISANQKEE